MKKHSTCQEKLLKHTKMHGRFILKLKKEAEVRDFIPNFEKIALFGKEQDLIITARAKAYDIVSRYFAPTIGINEDPACGSVHC